MPQRGRFAPILHPVPHGPYDHKQPVSGRWVYANLMQSQFLWGSGRILLLQPQQLIICHSTSTKGIHQNAYRMGYTDGISQLYFALASQSSSNYILCHPACCISCATVYLAGVFTGEGTTAMASISTISIYNNFSAGQNRSHPEGHPQQSDQWG